MKRIHQIIITLGALLISTFLAATPAEASSWKCQQNGQYSVCLKTTRLDSSHISGVNMQATKSGAGCVNARLHHGVAFGDWDIGYSWLQIWSDNGAFQICQNQTRSFYWSHGGAGAYVPPSSFVMGYMQVASNRSYSGKVFRSEI